jgi:KaiC/GvpD/RAD55 family RecA-like ATPase
MAKRKPAKRAAKEELQELPWQTTPADRQSTGIPGFDELVEGGIPRKSLNLLSGSCGTGKTTFGGQFIYTGALAGEPGVYISMEESPESVQRNWETFGWGVGTMIEKGKMLIVQPELYKYDVLLRSIEDSIDSINAQRVVVDSLALIGLYFQDPFQVRKNILDFNRMLKRMDCTSLAITEVEEGSNRISSFGVEEYVADGVIILHYIKQGNTFNRAVSIRKMRGTKHSTKIHPTQIERNGIVVYATEELFSDLK